MTLKPSQSGANIVWRGGEAVRGTRSVAAEVPVAFVYDGGTEAVMMATPADLQDFALGFSLNEGIVSSPDEIGELAIVEVKDGIELRASLSPRNREALVARRRHRARNKTIRIEPQRTRRTQRAEKKRQFEPQRRGERKGNTEKT